MDNDISKYIFIRLSAEHRQDFLSFLDLLIVNNDHQTFHPHNFDNQTIDYIIRLSTIGSDEYWLLIDNNNVLVYGLLRGWSEGFTIPSIGIAVSPKYRGLGLAEQMMLFLHSRAKDRGSNQIRLTVHKNNYPAIKLYTKLGYIFDDHSDSSLVGFINI